MKTRLEFGKPIPPELLPQNPVKANKEPLSAEFRDLTEEEAQAASCLNQITFPPASFDKRFGRNMHEATRITDKGALQLWRIIHRYRRQITHPNKAQLLKIAEERKPEDMRNK